MDFSSCSDREVLEAIGDSIKGSRIANNMTLVELAEKCEINKSTLSRIEGGQINTTILVLIRIYIALGREKEIENIFPEPSDSPILLSKSDKNKDHLPQRVKKSKKNDDGKNWNWED